MRILFRIQDNPKDTMTWVAVKAFLAATIRSALTDTWEYILFGSIV
jgi:hypothetical protein